MNCIFNCLAFLNLIVFSFSVYAQEGKPIHIGIFTDCQYCDCPDKEIRFYRLSLTKLDSCIETFNSLQLDAIFSLGDMIDHKWSNYDAILPRFKHFRAPFYPVLGNHDYMIKKQYKPTLMNRLGLSRGYYRVDIRNWSFIILDGDDLSYFAPQTKMQKSERDDLVNDLYASMRFNGMIWNGGIGCEQMKWLKEQLTECQDAGQKVIVLCHFPLFSQGNHNLFNNKELFTLLVGFPSVKAYFDGHYHAGNYQQKQGIHLVNFRGMVDTPLNSFAEVTITADSILIRGYGREPSRRLGIR